MAGIRDALQRDGINVDLKAHLTLLVRIGGTDYVKVRRSTLGQHALGKPEHRQTRVRSGVMVQNKLARRKYSARRRRLGLRFCSVDLNRLV